LSEEYTIHWYGPYRLFGTTEDSVLTNSHSTEKGIYMWTVPYGKEYLPYWVGETGKSFSSRIRKHTEFFLYGFYSARYALSMTNGVRIFAFNFSEI